MPQINLTPQKQRELSARIAKSRLRLLDAHPFYGMLLLNLKFNIDLSADTAYTDGDQICFGYYFLDNISDSELDFVLMHEISHAALSHVLRGKDLDNEAFNLAADIVVNSNILKVNNDDISSISVENFGGVSIHTLPNGKEGRDFAAEEIYPELLALVKESGDSLDFSKLKGNSFEKVNSDKKQDLKGEGFRDDHSQWEQGPESDMQRDIWLQRMIDATELILTLDENLGSNHAGDIPGYMQRILKELKDGQLDWRTLLQNFVQEDIVDYSFTPPDRRFQDFDFFLPDFNEKDESVKNMLFMVDTSGSISDEMIADAFSEIKAAVDQFDGKLEGYLGFFDTRVYKPLPFDTVDNLKKIRPVGGGGTDFYCIFGANDQLDEPPESIVILTDGYAAWPPESIAQGIPVLWLINNEDRTPDWGKVARIKPR